MPIRLGKYGPQATDQDRQHLLNAVRNIGSDAAGIIPNTMDIEFVESAKGASSASVFEGLADYLDKQVSKLVLGQTMTSDHGGGGGGLAQAKVHENVRLDIKVDDARKLEMTINRDLIRAFVDLNWGPQKRYPWVRFPVQLPEDTKTLAANVAAVVPLGVKIAAQEVRERLGFREPDDDEEILQTPSGGSIDADPETGAVEVKVADDTPAEKTAKKAANRSRKKAPALAINRRGKSKTAKSKKKDICGHCGVAHNTTEQDDLDQVSAGALGDWQRVADPIVAPIRALVNSAGSYDELLAGLPKVLNQMDMGRMVESLAASMAIARGLGAAKP